MPHEEARPVPDSLTREPPNDALPEDLDNDTWRIAEAVLIRLAAGCAAPADPAPADQLRRAEARYRALVEQLPAITFLASLEGDTNELYVSPQIETVLGFSQTEWLSNPVLWYTQLHPDDRDRWQEDFARTVASGEPFRADYRFRARNGRVVWVHGQAQMVRDEAGRPLFLQGVAFDVTEQKEAEASLLRGRDQLEAEVSRRTAELADSNRALRAEVEERRQAEEAAEAARGRLRLFLESVPAPIAMLDRDLRYLYYSRRWLTDYHLPDQDLTGRRHYDVFPEVTEHWKEVHRTCLAGATMKSDEDRLERGDGKVQWVRWEARPWTLPDGEIGGIIIFSEDITERKQLENQLHQAQKMEAIGQLAGGVAHDFNNLLTIINGYSEILLTQLREPNPANQPLAAIRDAGERAAGLTSQLLAFSRRSVLEPRILDPNVVVTETGKMLTRLIGEDIRLSTALDPRVGRVKVDPGQFGQVLMNLAVNARDAMPTGGRLTIETRRIVLDEASTARRPDVRPGPHVMIAVSDTGCGMPEEVRARVFEPFFTTKGEGKGTGLGLATVFGIIKQSGGHVEVYSEVGVGTTFKIYMPVVEEAEVPTADPGAARVRGGEEKVLLVEDQAEVRKLALIALQSQGYEVIEAADAQEALDMVARAKPVLDILVTDVVMPGMNGRQLAEALRPQYPGLKVLFMSGYTDDAVVRHGLLQEQVAFLQKPYTPLALARRVRQVLDEG